MSPSESRSGSALAGERNARGIRTANANRMRQKVAGIGRATGRKSAKFHRICSCSQASGTTSNSLKGIRCRPRTLSMNKRPLKLLLIIATCFFALGSAKADKFTKEEQALLDKNRIMQMYKPDEHSRHFIARIESAADPKTGEK